MKRAKFLSPSLSQKHINFARNSVFGAAVVKGRRIVGDFVISSKDLTQPISDIPGIMQSAARVGIIKLIWQCAVSLSPANLMSRVYHRRGGLALSVSNLDSNRHDKESSAIEIFRKSKI